MRKWAYLYEEHFAMTTIGCPFLHHLTKDDRDALELLNFYIEDCFWEFTESGDHLDPASIVRLYDCKCKLTRMLKRLDGELDSYFEHLLLMSKYVLRRFKISEARLIIERDSVRTIDAFSSGDDSPLLNPQADGTTVFIEDFELTIKQP